MFILREKRGRKHLLQGISDHLRSAMLGLVGIWGVNKNVGCALQI